VGPWTEAEVAARLAKMNSAWAPLAQPYLAPLGRPAPGQFDGWLRAATAAVDASGAFGAGAAEARANFDQLLASPYGALAWTELTLGQAGYDPAEVDGVDGSPFAALDPSLAAEREAARVLAGRHAVCLDPEATFSDATLVGLARDYARRGLSYDEIVADVRKNSFREVMLHEIGHTLGLRHNFGGSYDAFNFRPEYWALRADGDMGPRHTDPETSAEVDGRIREFQYSAVMDYPGSRNVGWVGLGHHDEAAVKFGYGELVEVLTQVPEAPAIEGLPNVDGISFVAAYASSNVLPSVLLNYTSGEYLELHYTDYPAMAGDLEARDDVPLAHLTPTIGEGGGFGDGLVVADTRGGVAAGMPAVPYRFCGDEFAVGMTCARFDEGADPYEVLAFYQERYWNDYLLTNFARQRYGFGDSDAYVARMQDRIFEPLRTWERYYALFHGLFAVDTDPWAAEYFAADRGWGGWTAGTDETFRLLVKVVTRPEAGPHAEVTRPDGVVVLSPTYSSGTSIPLVQGAYYESEWDYDSGYYWFDKQLRVGTYFDRMLALQTLTDTTSYDYLGYDTASDPRQYAIGFQDLYRDPLAVTLGRLAADDVGALAPVLTGEAELLFPDPLSPGDPWPPPKSTQVAPALYWLSRFDADLFGLALLDHGYDRTFLNRARIYLDGTGEAPTPGPDQEVVTYHHPATGKTYVAWSFPDADGVELGASARMLAKANALAARCPTDAAACVELDRFTTDLDLHVEMYDEFQHDGE
ncbi:MAG: zinc-dependent metalloprotease, partial [Myxococcota bacterium]